jgi:hypothetical protein
MKTSSLGRLTALGKLKIVIGCGRLCASRMQKETLCVRFERTTGVVLRCV